MTRKFKGDIHDDILTQIIIEALKGCPKKFSQLMEICQREYPKRLVGVSCECAVVSKNEVYYRINRLLEEGIVVRVKKGEYKYLENSIR